MASSSPKSTSEEVHLSVVKNVIAGVMSVPVCLALYHTLPQIWIPLALFAGSALNTVASTFMECVLKNMNWKYTILDSLIALVSFSAGGLIPMLCGMLVKPRVLRIVFLVISCGFVTGGAILNWKIKNTEGGDSNSGERRPTKICVGWVWFVSMIGTGVFVTIADEV